MRWMVLFAIGMLVSVSLVGVHLSSVKAEGININACSVLTSNTVYVMNGSITGAVGSCMQFNGADNVTFDCKGYVVDGDDTGSSDYGFWLNDSNSGSYNVTVQNCTITDFSYGIYLYSSSNNTFQNITISSNTNQGFHLDSSSNNNNLIGIDSSYNTNYGFILYSDCNNNNLTDITAKSNYIGLQIYLSSNNVLTNITASSNSNSGLYLDSISSNSIINSSIILSTTKDYYLLAIGTTNNFTNTNFTSARKIQFADTTSNFNYQDDQSSSLWLKTNLSAGKTVTRLISSWSQTNMTWNESISVTTATGYYLLQGLIPDSEYSIYNSTINPTYNLKADSSGKLSFPIKLTTTVQQIRVLNVTSAVPPSTCWHVEDGLCWLPPNCNVTFSDFLGACFT
jgi:parallel beta-helix repeat protein